MAAFLLMGCGKADDSQTKAALFTLVNIQNGGQINLTDYRGQVVYLDFWASWCKPCIRSFPKLDELHRKYSKQGFTVLAVNLDQNKALALDFLKANPVSYPNVYDEGAKIAKKYGVNSMPTSFFIDRKGEIRLSHQGFNPGDEIKIEKAIQLLISDE